MNCLSLCPSPVKTRVGITTRSFQLDNSLMGQSSSGPLYNQYESQSRNLCFSSTRISYLRSGSSVFVLEGNVIRFFPCIQVSCLCSSEDYTKRLQGHSYCTSLAKTMMVSRSCTGPFKLHLRRDIMSQFIGKVVLANLVFIFKPGYSHGTDTSQDMLENLLGLSNIQSGQSSVIGCRGREIDNF